ncbi:MAG TPA: carboxylesterase family protein [Chitinispirillaceae bacterium]|nr:carboxylesterase family protein [Chitinispirillaceae bacterium]
MYSVFKIFASVCLIALLSSAQIYSSVRFKESCFDSISTRMDIYYRTAPDYKTNPDSLFMDFYEPKNDTASLRPVIIMLYGGSFVKGSRKDTLITTYSSYFAKCGYTVCAIDYRIGIDSNTLFPQYEVPKALFRAIQDSRAAVRFIRKNASILKIDSTRIFGMGYSAGAITLIHHSYVDTAEAGKNLLLSAATAMLGSMDQGEDLKYSSNINCIINCCGAIADTSWIKSGETPILSFHGTADQIVPYGKGYINNDTATIIMFGSSILDLKAKSLGIVSQLFSFEGADHYLTGEPRITIPISTVNFLYGFLNNSGIRNRTSFTVSRIPSNQKICNQYFDIAGRLIKNQSMLSSALIVHRDNNNVQNYLSLRTKSTR